MFGINAASFLSLILSAVRAPHSSLFSPPLHSALHLRTVGARHTPPPVFTWWYIPCLSSRDWSHSTHQWHIIISQSVDGVHPISPPCIHLQKETEKTEPALGRQPALIVHFKDFLHSRDSLLIMNSDAQWCSITYYFYVSWINNCSVARMYIFKLHNIIF